MTAMRYGLGCRVKPLEPLTGKGLRDQARVNIKGAVHRALLLDQLTKGKSSISEGASSPAYVL